MKAIVYGVGAVGARVARQFVSNADFTSVVLIDEDETKIAESLESLGAPATAASISALQLKSRLDRFRKICAGADVVVLATLADHADLAEVALNAGAHVVSVSDDLQTVQALIELDAVAKRAAKNLVIGAGFAPGVSCLLARHAAQQLDVTDEIHVAKFGTGGPECARQHHKALRSESLDWRNQDWEKRTGGTGRELVWFPDPVGGLDCYVAELPDSLLLKRAFPALVRASSRVSATRRDQATKWLPMMRRPHPEGMIGAVRTEVRGWKSDRRNAIVLGVLDRPAVAAGIMAAVMAELAISEELSGFGAAGVAELVVETTPVLAQLAKKGVKAAIFEGAPAEGRHP